MQLPKILLANVGQRNQTESLTHSVVYSLPYLLLTVCLPRSMVEVLDMNIYVPRFAIFWMQALLQTL